MTTNSRPKFSVHQIYIVIAGIFFSGDSFVFTTRKVDHITNNFSQNVSIYYY